MTYSNTLHGYWFLGITVTILAINHFIIPVLGTYTNLICLFLILSIGISHGSLDNLKGNRVLKLYKIKNKAIFYLAYIALALLLTILWLLLPSLSLVIFFIIASYHFGKEDCQITDWSEYVDKIFDNIHFESKKDWEPIFYLIKGSIIIIAPLSFHFEETINIFKILFVDNADFLDTLMFFDEKGIFVIALWIVFFISLSFFIETTCIIALNIFLSPLVAFTVYFCFLHSIRHSVSLIKEIEAHIVEKEYKEQFRKTNIEISMNGIKIFLRKALPLTLITAILFVVSVFILTNYYGLDDAILKVIFIGLASLTFPHILLEYLIEKNEK
jgi:beta-carotene 15,15'-dioxygenase